MGLDVGIDLWSVLFYVTAIGTTETWLLAALVLQMSMESAIPFVRLATIIAGEISSGAMGRSAPFSYFLADVHTAHTVEPHIIIGDVWNHKMISMSFNREEKQFRRLQKKKKMDFSADVIFHTVRQIMREVQDKNQTCQRRTWWLQDWRFNEKHDVMSQEKHSETMLHSL